ncbi:MAG TPA: NUDIX hydrolase [Rhodospirillaceae bacterium]|nr:NUDIX hydrolase [Rhodospirillaceae bacterium]
MAMVGPGKKRKRKLFQQYAALPWTLREGVLLVMLLTSRETRRWIIPKGWPIKNLAPCDVAAKEAFEEGGLLGEIVRDPIAQFHYSKRMEGNKRRRCLVDVFPLAVKQELDAWPEQNERSRAWMTPEEAADRVAESGLVKLLRKLPLP